MPSQHWGLPKPYREGGVCRVAVPEVLIGQGISGDEREQLSRNMKTVNIAPSGMCFAAKIAVRTYQDLLLGE